MLEALQGFVRELRARGSRISQAEVIDAARAAAAVGPEERDRFRTALTMTLAKDRRDRAIFDEAFDAYFAPPRRSGGERGRGGGAGAPGVGGPGAGARSGSGRPGKSRPAEEPSSAGKPPIERPSHARGAPPRSSPPPRSTRPRSLRPDEIRKQLGLDPAQPRGRRGARDVGHDAQTREVSAAEDRNAATSRRKRRAVARVSADARDLAPREAASAGRVRLGRLLASDRPLEPPPPDLRRRNLRDPLSAEEERRIAREAARIVDEIRLVRARRFRRAPRGRLFMKRAIRENLATEGVPFRIPHQLPRLKRPRIVLVVDVSYSVARAAGLFLMMALEFLRPPRRASVWLFVDRPIEATDELRRWLRRESSAPRSDPDRPGAGGGRAAGEDSQRDIDAGVRGTRDLLRSPGNARRVGEAASSGSSWSPYGSAAGTRSRAMTGRRPGGGGRAAGAGIVPPGGSRSFLDLLQTVPDLDLAAASDYGRAFYALASGPLRALGRDATLIVLGDGRTNVYEPLPWAFEEIAGRARRVLWLVPEPRSRWGTGDSALLRYLPFCDVAVEAADLDGLAHGVRELLA